MLPGTPVDIVGFGETSYGATPLSNTQKLHVLNTLVVDFDTPTTVGIFQSATGPGGTCDGDSGGPWIANFNGTDYVGAVTSVGHHCATSSVAARVSAALDDFLAPYLPVGAGGTGGTGAASGAAGEPGGGGSAAGTGGVGNGSGASQDNVSDSSGCALTPRASADWGALTIALLLALGARRRIVRR